MTKRLKNPSFWMAVVLLVANGAVWVYALAPGEPAVQSRPRQEPGLAELRDRLREGGHSGEPFSLEITSREAAETIVWYLDGRPNIPFGEPEVAIAPGGVAARGVAEIAGLRVGLAGEARIELLDGVPVVTLQDLDVAGVAVPGFVRDRIQSEIDAQFGLARDLPVRIDLLRLEEGRAIVQGVIR
jgi:hypothetical protein